MAKLKAELAQSHKLAANEAENNRKLCELLNHGNRLGLNEAIKIEEEVTKKRVSYVAESTIFGFGGSVINSTGTKVEESDHQFSSRQPEK